MGNLAHHFLGRIARDRQVVKDYYERRSGEKLKTRRNKIMSENCHVEPVEKPLDHERLSNALAAFLAVGGMGCPTCANRVRNGLVRLSGVLAAEVELEQGVAVAAFDPQVVTIKELIAAVAEAGNDGRHHYQAALIKEMPAGDIFRWVNKKP
jgi:copper chaperone CopZ